MESLKEESTWKKSGKKVREAKSLYELQYEVLNLA
jgi:hypothetical protein